MGSYGTLKDQLISVGSLFVISGNPLEPGSVSASDNQGKLRMEEEMNACPCTCSTQVWVDVAVILYHAAPQGGQRQPREAVKNNGYELVRIVKIQEYVNVFHISKICYIICWPFKIPG